MNAIIRDGNTNFELNENQIREILLAAKGDSKTADSLCVLLNIEQFAPKEGPIKAEDV